MTIRAAGRALVLPAILLIFMVSGMRRSTAQAGPPFQTDDPTPLELHHYEAYVFGLVDATPVALGSYGPAFEFNWGAVPRVQLHAILPAGEALPWNSPVYDPSGAGPSAYGLQDMELGVKLGFIKQTRHRPQIGTFTMFEVPTGDSSKGLGVGKVWYKVPLWVEKEFGPWSLVGGGGYGVNSQDGFRDYPYGGFLVKRVVNERLELSVESFSHAKEGIAAAQTQASSMIDAGGYYHFKQKGWQLLFAYGHSVWGQTENYGYLGIYKIWGKGGGEEREGAEKKEPGEAPMRSEQPR
jgi:hypothetical protein